MESDPKYRRHVYLKCGFIPIDPLTQFCPQVGNIVSFDQKKWEFTITALEIELNKSDYTQTVLNELKIDYENHHVVADNVVFNNCSEDQKFIQEKFEALVLESPSSFTSKVYGVIVSTVKAGLYQGNHYNALIGLQLQFFAVTRSFFTSKLTILPYVIGK